MKRKYIAAVAAACLALCLLLAGCSVSEEDYPPLEKVELSALTLETVENDVMSLQYPADAWSAVGGTAPLIVYYNETANSGQAVNINAQQAGTYSGKFTEKYMTSLTESITETYPYIDIIKAELRSINGKSVIYTETVTQYTDEMLDRFLEQGVVTQEDIDNAGGREALLATPPTDQITLYTVSDSMYLNIYTGTYYEESQKNDVLQTMIVMAQTTSVKPQQSALAKIFQ